MQTYKSVFQELSVEDSGIVLRGDRFVVPKAFQQKVVQLAHEGHQGIVKTKQFIRRMMWFSGIDAAVQEAVERCLPCQAATDTKQKEPLLPTELPTAPWLRVTTDFNIWPHSRRSRVCAGCSRFIFEISSCGNSSFYFSDSSITSDGPNNLRAGNSRICGF